MNIYDIAKASGVSTATVSRVLNGSERVSEQTRRKVLSVMEAQGYRPNAFARGLGLGTMRMVGILCTDVSDPFYASAVSLLEGALRRMDYDMLLYCTGSEPADRDRYVELLLDRHVDAILLVGSVFADPSGPALEKAAAQIPVVLINGSVPDGNIYCVDSDVEAAFRSAVSRLFSAGARRILYLYDVLTYGGRMKLSGYRDGLSACGIPYDPSLCVRLERDPDSAVRSLRGLIAGGLSFDAVLCAEDVFAVAAGKALRGASLSLPVIGCNNSILAVCASPALTSIDMMLESICETAANTLNILLEGRQAPHRAVISSRLVERETFRLP